MKSVLLVLVIVESGSAQFSTTGRANITKVHNDLRSAIAKGTYTAKGTLEPAAANMRKLKWNAYLGITAQEYADKCPNSYSNTEGVGENLYTIWYARSPNLDNSGVEASKAWAKEFQDIGWTSILLDPKTLYSGIGHATQMAWAETNLIGCGVKNCGKDAKHYDYYKVVVVCQYQKQGNVLNTNIYQKGDTCSSCPSGSTCEVSSGLCA
ncbi:hypothetical protein B9Z55_017882 [Caenorhabditis nigoni]|nr:hypothetical protein B9Z55_017882 [Caenorhabditis nigoni]